MKTLRLRALVLATLLLSPSAIAARLDSGCASGFTASEYPASESRFAAPEGTKVPSIELDYPVSTAVYRVGNGYNGVVYRVEPPDGTRTGIKRYERLKDLESDLMLLERFREDELNGVDLGFRVPEAHRRGGRNGLDLEIQFISGQSLEILLESDLTPPRLRSALEAAYRSKLERMSYYLRRRLGASLALSRDRIPTIITSWKDAKGVSREIWVKPDNVIVERETLEMFLVDPH